MKKSGTRLACCCSPASAAPGVPCSSTAPVELWDSPCSGVVIPLEYKPEAVSETGPPGLRSEVQAADAQLVEADVMGELMAQQVGQIIQRVAHQLFEVGVVERVQLHELAFFGRHRQAVASQRLGVAHDLFELRLRLGVAPLGQTHGHERNATHQR